MATLRTQQAAITLLTVVALVRSSPAGAQTITYDFNSGGQGWAAASESGGANVWTHAPTGGGGGTGGWLVNGSATSSIKTLTSPAFVVATSGAVSVAFQHRFNFEFEAGTPGDAFDGGHLRVSVNGGGFTAVPGASLTGVGYTPDIDGVDGLGGAPGFSDVSAGYAGGSLVSTTANLGSRPAPASSSSSAPAGTAPS